MDPGTLITIGVQIASSLYNQFFNKKNLEEVKKIQREAKEAAQKRSLERDYEKFKRSCKYQYLIEEEAHIAKIKAIEQDFLTSFEKLAHKATLRDHYPLNISPYIISRSVIPVNATQLNNSRQEVFCILTNSNNKTFNKEVIPYLDNALCNLISTYWNKESLHTTCYFSDTWNDSFIFCDDNIANIKTTIKTPTIAVSPCFEKTGKDQYSLVIKLNMWGIGSEVSCYLDSGLKYSSIPVKYTTEQIDDIVNKLIPSLICMTGQCVDVYYWIACHLPPLLPSLISNNCIVLDDNTYKYIKNVYQKIYNALVLGQVDDTELLVQDKSILIDVASINQCNHPYNNIRFLEDLSNLLELREETELIIRNSFIHLYENITGEKYISVNNVNVQFLGKQEIDMIKRIITIAKKTGNEHLYKELIVVIKNRIQYWS